MTQAARYRVGVGRPRRSRQSHLVLCKFCFTARVVRNGVRKGTQYWLCRTCGRGFVNNGAAPRRRYPAIAVIAANQAFWSGWSTERIRDMVERDAHVRPARSAVYRWIAEVRRLGLGETYKPRLGDVWTARGDEVLKAEGTSFRVLWLFDSETRFAVATRLSRTCNSGDIRHLVRTAYGLTGLVPREIVTGGKWGSGAGGLEISLGGETRYVKVSIGHPDTPEQVSWRQTSALASRVERFGTARKARYMLPSLRFLYNFFRRQACLGNRTPAESAGIRFPYKTQKDMIYALYGKVAETAERLRVRGVRAGVVTP